MDWLSELIQLKDEAKFFAVWSNLFCAQNKLLFTRH